MPLLDHFRPPLAPPRHWHSFHNAWATFIASALNQHLPEGWFAEPNVQFGIEVDVAAFDDTGPGCTIPPALSAEWQPPAPVQTIPFPLVTDSVEISVYDGTAGAILVGAIELLSPANKDRPTNREAFVSKCQTYLQQRAGLIIVDIVTQRGGNLHRDLLARLSATTSLQADLYATAYRLVEQAGQVGLEVWEEPLAVGHSLPTLPLWLSADLCMPVDLEATYQRTCREQRIRLNGSQPPVRLAG